MMEMLLRNRERVLTQLADLYKKLDAVEKVEIYRKIRVIIFLVYNIKIKKLN